MSTLMSFGQCQFEDAVEEVLDPFARALGNMPVIEEAEVSFLLFLSCEEKDHPDDFHEYLAYVPPSTRGTVKGRKYYWSTHLWEWGVKYMARASLGGHSSGMASGKPATQ